MSWWRTQWSGLNALLWPVGNGQHKWLSCKLITSSLNHTRGKVLCKSSSSTGQCAFCGRLLVHILSLKTYCMVSRRQNEQNGAVGFPCSHQIHIISAINVKIRISIYKVHINLVNAAKHILIHQLLPTRRTKVEIRYVLLKLACVANGQSQNLKIHSLFHFTRL